MNSSTELVSVLLSTYNSEATIEKSLISLLNQTYKNLEILIADDGSTDNTKEICKKFQLNDERILLFSNKKNIGLTKSLNSLAQKASGSLIARQDADDVSLPERIEKQIQFMNKKKLDAVTTRSLVKQNNKKRPGISFYIPNKLLINRKNPFIHGTLIIKENIFKDIGYYDERFYFAQDYKLFYDLLSKGYKVKTLNEALYILNTENNISSENLDRQNYYADCVRLGKIP
jgi:glycosyltransferase involved in cell wall biosynthesis|tara:strand:+ start:328 stop:1017 length:690 start_codon:yes stop_codon:yes gene_type:complete